MKFNFFNRQKVNGHKQRRWQHWKKILPTYGT